MEYKEILELMNSIMLGYRIVPIKLNEDIVNYRFNALSVKNEYAILIEEKRLYKYYENAGLLSEKEIIAIQKEHNVWTEDNDTKIKDLELNLKKLKAGQEDNKFNKKALEKINQYYEVTERELNKIRAEKESIFQNSIESQIEQDIRSYTAFMVARNLDNAPIAPTIDEFLKLPNVYNIMYEALVGGYISEAKIRTVARCGSWRSLWNVAKNNTNVFGDQLTADQKTLIYWSQVYDAAYESMERPGDEVINDDEKLDEWFSEQSKKQKRDSYKAPRPSNKPGRKPGVVLDEEVFILSDRQSSSEVYETYNDKYTRARLQAEHETIKEKGQVTEFDLRKGHIQRKRITR